jgi:hypothetical protein
MRERLQSTVSLKENVARWARRLGEIVKDRMLAEDGYERAMRRSLTTKPFLKTDGRYLSRAEAHVRSSVR